MHRSLLICMYMCVGGGGCCSGERKDKKKVSFHMQRSLSICIGLFSYASVSFDVCVYVYGKLLLQQQKVGQEEGLFSYVEVSFHMHRSLFICTSLL